MRIQSAWLWVFLGLTACGDVSSPAPGPHSGPRFVLNSAPPSPGAVFFHFEGQRMIGRLELPSGLPTTGPLRLAVIWSREFAGTDGTPLTLSPTLDGSTGTQTFEATVAPPDEAFLTVVAASCTSGRFASAHGQVVLFMDVNGNGALDRFDSDRIDHVVGVSAFPTELFGFPTGDTATIAYQEACGAGGMSAGGPPTDGVRGEVRFRLFDDPRLELVACSTPGALTAATACGITLEQTPRVTVSAGSSPEQGGLWISAADGLEVFVDDQSQGIVTGGSFTASSAAWLDGAHRVRVTSAGLRDWDATITWPQPVVVLSRPALLTEGQSYVISWSTQPGISNVFLLFDQSHGRGSLDTRGGAVTYQQGPPSLNEVIRFELQVRFSDFPGGTGARFEIPVRTAK